MIKNLLATLLIVSTIIVKAQNPLAIPGTIESTDINLTLQNGTHQFLSGELTNTMGVNGDILGPTLIVNKGDNLNINVTNNLGQPTTIHWHGMHISADNDGGPHTIIDPGTTWNPQFEVLNNASTMWYHPHLDEFTDEHVSKGIAGFIIIKDDIEAALDLPRTYGVDDIPLAIQTKQFDSNNQIIHHTNHDDTLMVNATLNPMVDVPAQIVRLRLLNGTTQRVLNIGLSDNRTFYQIGTDGGLKEAPLALTRLQLASGERTEILVDLNDLQGDTLYLMSYASEFGNGIYGGSAPGMNSSMPLDGYAGNALNGADFNILQLNVVAQTASPVTTIPTSLVTITPYLESDSNESRTMTLRPITGGFNQLDGDFTINDVSLDMNTINITIPLNNTEIWTIQNSSAISHPFHIHDIQFNVLELNGTPAPEYLKGWKDTVLVPAGSGTVKVITKFADFSDENIPYMYHCHMLTHEDGGMMGQFVVVDTANVSDINTTDGFNLFPNPSNKIYITAQLTNPKDHILAYAVINKLGQIIAYHKVTKNEISNIYSLPIFEYANGAYILKIYTENARFTKKFIIGKN